MVDGIAGFELPLDEFLEVVLALEAAVIVQVDLDVLAQVGEEIVHLGGLFKHLRMMDQTLAEGEQGALRGEGRRLPV